MFYFSWLQKCVKAIRPATISRLDKKRRRTRLAVESLEGRVVPASLNLSAPATTLMTGSLVQVFIDVDSLGGGSQLGLSKGNFNLEYNSSILSITAADATSHQSTDIKLGSLIVSNQTTGDFSYAASTSSASGVGHINVVLSSTNGFAATTGGHLIELDFHVVAGAALGSLGLIDLEATDSQFTAAPTSLSAQGGTAYALANSPAISTAASITSAAAAEDVAIKVAAPLSIAIGAPSAAGATTGPVTFAVNYTSTIFNSSSLSAGNVHLIKTGTANGTLSFDSGTGAARIVTVSGITGNGTLAISIDAGSGLNNDGGTAPASGNSATFVVDNIVPTLAISGPSAATATAGPITYTLTYTDANFNASSLTTSNVHLNAIGTATGTLSFDSGTGATRTVTISNIAGNGTLGISVDAGSGTDAGGNPTAAAGPSVAVVVANSTTASGSISGIAFLDINSSGTQTGGEPVLAGANVTLTGTSNSGKAVTASVVADAKGSYQFQNVPLGSYQVLLNPVTGLTQTAITAASVTLNAPAGGAALSSTQNLGLKGGLSTAFLSLRQFLNIATIADLSTIIPSQTPGSGTVQVGTGRANSSPVVSKAIADVNVAANAADTVMNLGSHFFDSDYTNSLVRLNTSAGPINVQLFDSAAPQTVANFFDYINSGAYDNAIFHRLAAGFVLQGGGFKFNATTHTLDPIATLPNLPNEFGASNTIGTLAMAKLGSSQDSATNQFFINLADNSSNLNFQNGGFTVFGKIVAPADQTVVNTLTSATIKAATSPFDSIPLTNYTGTNFPTDATAANFLTINSVTTVKRDEFLTYSIVSNSNPTLVTPTLNSGDNQSLALHYAAGHTGTATIVVRATDTLGATVDQTFHVNVT